MARVAVTVEKSKLVGEDDHAVRVATRLPSELKVELKIMAAVMNVPLNAMYALILREFMELGIYKRKDFTWLAPRTSPRKDRHGGPRGDSDWVQVLMIIPNKLASRVEAEAAAHNNTSLATFAYTALNWYVEAHNARHRASSTAKTG